MWFQSRDNPTYKGSPKWWGMPHGKSEGMIVAMTASRGGPEPAANTAGGDWEEDKTRKSEASLLWPCSTKEEDLSVFPLWVVADRRDVKGGNSDTLPMPSSRVMPLNRDSARCQPKEQTEEDGEEGEDVSWVNEPKQEIIVAHLKGAVPSPKGDLRWRGPEGNALEMMAIGEPYDGDRHVRFDGEVEVSGLSLRRASSTLPYLSADGEG